MPKIPFDCQWHLLNIVEHFPQDTHIPSVIFCLLCLLTITMESEMLELHFIHAYIQSPGVLDCSRLNPSHTAQLKSESVCRGRFHNLGQGSGWPMNQVRAGVFAFRPIHPSPSAASPHHLNSPSAREHLQSLLSLGQISNSSV